MDELPIDVWANVAKFMSQSDRIIAYYSLKHLNMIPVHHSEYETLMRFLEVAEYDKSKEAKVLLYTMFSINLLEWDSMGMMS